MELAEYIFVFSEYMLKDAVKETICVENWENSDYDSRYKEYCENYLQLKKKYIEVDEGIFQEDMSFVSKKLQKKFFDNFRNRLYKKLEQNHKLDPGENKIIVNALNSYEENNNIDPDLIKEIRRLEEKLFV